MKISNLKLKIDLTFVQQILLFLILLFLPTQLGKHFWPEFSYVLGTRVDYLSPTLYFTDVLIFILFGITLFRLLMNKIQGMNIKYKISNSKYQIENWKFEIGNYWKFVLLVVFLIVGILFSKSPMNGWYSLLKLLEMTFVGFYVAKHWSKSLLLPLSFGILFESSLAIAQFLKQASIGGIFYFFGERTFNSQTPNIANASLDGVLTLRPYATFPHPNVLAAYLTIVMTIVISNIKYQKSKIERLFIIVSIAIGTVGLLLTMSRTSIILWCVVLFIYLLRKNHSLLYLIFTFLFLIFLTTSLSYRFTSLFDADSEAVSQRTSLNNAAIKMIKQSPVFGVGLGNFLARLPEVKEKELLLIRSNFIQPVHNIYLLIADESGLIGLGFFLWLITRTYKNIQFQISNFKFQILTMVLILGLFDHYFFTLQQGQLLFAFIIGLCWLKRNEL